MQVCLLDVRCCQDAGRPQTAAMRSAHAILEGAREGLPGARLLGLIDPTLSNLPVETAALLDGVKTTAYTADLEGACCFIQLSPMTHDPLFVARLLLRPEIPTIACVPEIPPFGTAASARLDAHLSLRWLARYDLFLPFSTTASRQLASLLGAPEEARFVIGEIDTSEKAAAAQPPAIAGRFWRAIRQFISQPLATAETRAPRIAIALALSPKRTDLVAYATALCSELGQTADLDLYTPTDNPVQLNDPAALQPLSPVTFLSGRYDRVVVLIDGETTAATTSLIDRYGSAVIDLGRNALQAAAAAEPCMRLAGAETPGIPLPPSTLQTFTAAELEPSARETARERIGVSPHELLLASFDGLQSSRTPIEYVWALDLLRLWGFDARLHLLGPALIDTAPLQRLCADLGLAPWLSYDMELAGEQSHRDQLIAADIGLQLQPNAHTPSVRLADCLAAGLPCVISASTAQAMDAPAYVATVPDRPSPVLIAEAAASLSGRRPAAGARKAYADAHGMDRHVAALCNALNLPCRSTSI